MTICNRGFHVLYKIGNNANIGIRSFTTRKQNHSSKKINRPGINPYLFSCSKASDANTGANVVCL